MSPRALRRHVERRLAAEPALGPAPPPTMRLLEHAIEEAGGLGHRFIGTEHLLLGVLREGSGPAAETLLASGITLEGARAMIRSLLGEREEGEPGSRATP